MKSAYLLILLLAVCVNLSAQPTKPQQKKEKHDKVAKSQDKKSGKPGKETTNQGKKHEDIIWEGTTDQNGKGPLPSKNQPASVRKAFLRDYPNAVNVRWSKYRGDWTATFGNGVFTSTAVYHANGDRRDTRTPIPRQDLPRRIEDIFKKSPQTRVEDIIKINLPQRAADIFRIKTIADGILKFRFFNTEGQEVKYDY